MCFKYPNMAVLISFSKTVNEERGHNDLLLMSAAHALGMREERERAK